MCVSAPLGRVGLSIALFAFLVPLSPLDVRAAEPVSPDYVHRVWTVEHGRKISSPGCSHRGTGPSGSAQPTGWPCFTFYHRLSRLEAQGVDILWIRRRADLSNDCPTLDNVRRRRLPDTPGVSCGQRRKPLTHNEVCHDRRMARNLISQTAWPCRRR
jgi:hypothetical protein